MCFSAAQHAKWLPSDLKDVPRSSYTRYQSCNTSIEDLVAKAEDLGSFLAKVEAKVSKAGFEEMLNEEGNTFVYLLNTQVRNRSFTKKHRKDIDELNKASELTLGEGEIWEEGEERVYCDSWEVGIAETKLLLCKATEVVMEKCFQLLGITLESSYFGDKQESLGLPKSLLQVGRLNHGDPPKKPNSRFQLFSGLPDAPDGGTVALFHCDWHDQIRVTNHRELDLGNPSSSHLVPLSSSMEISTQLYATTLKEDALFLLSRSYAEMDFAYFWKLESDSKCDMLLLKSDDGNVRMYYVLLKDAVDCAIYNFNEDREVHAEVYAFYGSDFFDKNEDPFVKNFYTASLYEGHIAGKVGEVPLKRSMMAVPAKGSIIIKAQLHDYDSKGHGYLDEDFTFDAQPRDGCKKVMRGSCGCCSLSVSVVWSQD
ncbi:hypothetical protein Tco_0743265 [Tanacetum coccineum]